MKNLLTAFALIAALLAAFIGATAQAHRSDRPHHAPREADAQTYTDVRYAAKQARLKVGPSIRREGVPFRWCSQDGKRCHDAQRPAYARDIADGIRKHRANLRARSFLIPHLVRIRQCESGGNYSTNTGNGFFGAFQFTLSTWRSVGGRGYPHHASRREQDKRAMILYRRSGPGQWPVCQYR